MNVGLDMNVLGSDRGIEDARTGLHIIVIVLVCLATRLAAGWVVGNRFQPTTWEYETLATNMLAGQGYVPVCTHVCVRRSPCSHSSPP